MASCVPKPSVAQRIGAPTLGSIVGILTAAWGAFIASFPLNDNSFLTHLATGRLILAEGAIPDADPYTFTAFGTAWTVQSWLPAAVYAVAESAAGVVGLRAVAIAVFVAAAALVWRLSREASSLFPRVALVGLAVFVSTPLWSMRPLMVGVIGLSLVVLAIHGHLSPLWLLATMWIWVNSHGSFPFAFGFAALALLGTALDREPIDRHTRVLVFVTIGSMLGAVGPLGLEALTFPLTAIEQSDFFAEVIEWQSPNFRSVADRAFLIMVGATILGLVRTRRWSDALPAVAFIAAALVAQRNIVMAAVVLVPVLARSFGSIGAIKSANRPRGGLVVATLASLVVTVSVAAALVAPAEVLGRYPGGALAWWDQHSDETERIATDVGTGNFIEVLDGPTGTVFVDDRFDMFPRDVLDDALTLERGRPSWYEVLDRRRIDAVVWERVEPLGSLIAASGDWRVAYSDSRWIVAVPRYSSQ